MANAMSLPDPAPRAVKYRRVSTLMQARHGFSLGAQSTDLDKLAAELGAEVVGDYEDTDSGAEWDLPGLNAVLDMAKRRDFELLLVPDPDRFARSMAKQLVLEEELKRHGVQIRYATLRLGDSAEDQLLKNVRSSIAEYERSKIALRTSRGRRAKAEQGLVPGNGWAPYGYRFARELDAKTGRGRVVGLEPDPQAAAIVRRIFAEILSMATEKVCKGLRDDGVPTMFGGRWSSTTVLGILDNPVYLGTFAWGRRDTHKRWRDRSEWLAVPVPALIDRPTWDAAKAALASRRRRTPARSRPRDFPLRAMLSCGYCGGALSCPTSGQLRTRYYWCLRNHPYRAEQDGKEVCRLPGVLGYAVEDYLWERVSATLLDPDYLAVGLTEARERHEQATVRQREALAAVDREVERLRARLRRITSERLDAEPGTESERALRAIADETEATIAKLGAERAELASLPSPGLAPEDIASLQAFAAEIADGLALTEPAKRREIYDLLGLRGRVTLDPEGIKFGRRHRFRIDWDGLIELPNGEREYKKTRLLFYTGAYEDWEAKYMPEPTAAS